jgi:uncharacterized membrane-anchored protein YhcB (DUF1043 family)
MAIDTEHNMQIDRSISSKRTAIFCFIICYTMASIQLNVYAQPINDTEGGNRTPFQTTSPDSSSQFQDIPNWTTMVAEIFIGIIITLLIFRKTKHTDNAIQDMISKIDTTTNSIDSSTREMDKIVKNIDIVTEKQSKVIASIEKRRNNRIEWFTHHSLTVLNSLKKRYEKLYEALEAYQQNKSEANRKHMVSIAKTANRISVNHTITLIQRDIHIAIDYINNPWLVAKFPDELTVIGDVFAMVENSFESYFPESEFLDLKEMIVEKISRIQFYIETLQEEKN